MASGATVVYLATMPKLIDDKEQEQRIARHQERRPPDWTTIESAYKLPQSIASLPSSAGFCIIDCLSVYISNLLVGPDGANGDTDPYRQEAPILAEVDRLLAVIEEKNRVQFAVVTNEVGWGVVPETALGRAFRDFLGLANQRFAAQSQEVWLTCVGLPLRLKPQKQSSE